MFRNIFFSRGNLFKQIWEYIIHEEMEGDIIVIAHVNVRSGTLPAGKPEGVQYGNLIELPLDKREISDWNEWVEIYHRNW